MHAPASRSGPLLDLVSIDPVERPFIKIDGERYNLRRPEECGLIELARLERAMAVIAELEPRADALSDEDAETLAGLLRTGVHIVLVSPLEVIDRLTDRQKLMVMAAFTAASERTTPKRKPRGRTSQGRTGARSSRASAPATERTTG